MFTRLSPHSPYPAPFRTDTRLRLNVVQAAGGRPSIGLRFRMAPPMKPLAPRSPAQILRSRAIGARVGTLIGVAWLAFGVSVLANGARVPNAIIGVVIAAVLLQRARRLIAASNRLPAPAEDQERAHRRVRSEDQT